MSAPVDPPDDQSWDAAIDPDPTPPHGTPRPDTPNWRKATRYAILLLELRDLDKTIQGLLSRRVSSIDQKVLTRTEVLIRTAEIQRRRVLTDMLATFPT